jgi:hypothetical protein
MLMSSAEEIDGEGWAIGGTYPSVEFHETRHNSEQPKSIKERLETNISYYRVKFHAGSQNPEIPMQHLPEIVMTTVEKERHRLIVGGKCGLGPYLFCATEVGHEGWKESPEVERFRGARSRFYTMRQKGIPQEQIISAMIDGAAATIKFTPLRRRINVLIAPDFAKDFASIQKDLNLSKNDYAALCQMLALQGEDIPDSVREELARHTGQFRDSLDFWSHTIEAACGWVYGGEWR